MPAPYGYPLAVNDVVQVVIVCQAFDQVGLNIIHYKVTSVVPAPFLGDVIPSLEGGSTALSGAYKSVLATEAEFRGYLVRRVLPVVDVEFTDTAGAGNGTVMGDLLPRQVSGLISKRAAVAGRRKGGRLYIPFPSEGDNDADSTPSVSYVTRLGVIASNLSSFLTARTELFARPVIAIRGVIAGHVEVIDSRNIANHVARTLWATQRRRGSYGRANVPPV